MKKANELRIPFTWQERHPILLDRCFYIPGHFAHDAAGPKLIWESPSLFGNQNPVAIEFCSGNGEWISEKARQYPDQNWVAVEKRFDRARKIWGSLQRSELNNLFVVCAEAFTFSRYYAPLNSVSQIFINFPDPWPKPRHAKHRLISPPFLLELEKILIDQKTVIIATDDRPYVDQILEVFAQHPHWKPVFPNPYFTDEWPGFGDSFFSRLWVGKGLSTHYLQYRLEK